MGASVSLRYTVSRIAFHFCTTLGYSFTKCRDLKDLGLSHFGIICELDSADLNAFLPSHSI